MFPPPRVVRAALVTRGLFHSQRRTCFTARHKLSLKRHKFPPRKDAHTGMISIQNTKVRSPREALLQVDQPEDDRVSHETSSFAGPMRTLHACTV